MEKPMSPTKYRYTFGGIALVALAWLGLLFLVSAGFIMIAYAAPFAIFYVVAVIGYVGAISEAHQFAKAQARPVPASEPARTTPRVLTVRRSEPRLL
jgi:hypothetical protein